MKKIEQTQAVSMLHHVFVSDRLKPLVKDTAEAYHLQKSDLRTLDTDFRVGNWLLCPVLPFYFTSLCLAMPSVAGGRQNIDIKYMVLFRMSVASNSKFMGALFSRCR